MVTSVVLRNSCVVLLSAAPVTMAGAGSGVRFAARNGVTYYGELTSIHGQPEPSSRRLLDLDGSTVVSVNPAPLSYLLRARILTFANTALSSNPPTSGTFLFIVYARWNTDLTMAGDSLIFLTIPLLCHIGTKKRQTTAAADPHARGTHRISSQIAGTPTMIVGLYATRSPSQFLTLSLVNVLVVP
jgi:hypothetical protein